MADRAARNLGGVLRGASGLRAHLGAVGVGYAAAGDGDGVLFGIARRSGGLVVDDEAAVGCRRNRAARDGERVLLDLVADVRASRPGFIVRGRFVVRRRMVLKLEARGRDLRRRRRMIGRVDRELEIAARRALDAARRRIGVRRALLEADAVRILHEDEIVCFVCLDRRVEFLGVDVELPPVEVARRTRIETQYGRTLRERMAVKVELQMIEVLDVAGLRVGVDVQGVVCRIRLVAAMDRAGDVRACGEAVLAVAEVDGVARGLACAVREACVDVACDCAAGNGDGARCCIARRRAVGDVAAVDAACNGAALEFDLVLRRASRGACCAQGCAVEAAVDCAVVERSGVFRRAAGFRAHLSTVGVEGVRARVEDEAVLFGVARGLEVAVSVALGVRDESAARDKRRAAARQGQLVVLYLVANLRASAPCVRGRAGGVACRVVPEAVAFEVDVLCRGAIAFGHDVGFVVGRVDAAARSRRAVVREVDVVCRMAHERQDRVARGARVEAVKVVDVEFLPVEARRTAVQGQECVACLDVAARRLEVDRVKIGNVARRHGVVDIERVVRGGRLAAAVDRADRRARSDGIGFRAEVDGVARGRARAVREAAVDVGHRAARDGHGVACGIARRRGMGEVAAVDFAVACARDRAARDRDLVARGAARLHGGEAAVDGAHRARLEVDGIVRAVEFRRCRRARARRPAAVGVAMRHAVDRQRVVRRRVADDGAAGPDRRRRIGVLELVAAVEDLLRRRRVGVGVDGVFVRAGRRNLLRARVMADADARHVLQEDGLAARRVARMLELAPVEVRHRAADKVQHGVRLVEGRVEVEVDHAEIGDVARRGIGVDVKGVVRIRRPAAAIDRARDGSGGVRRAIAEIDGVARRRARRRVSAVDIAAYRAAVEA